jgi:hypothetical protein
MPCIAPPSSAKRESTTVRTVTPEAMSPEGAGAYPPPPASATPLELDALALLDALDVLDPAELLDVLIAPPMPEPPAPPAPPAPLAPLAPEPTEVVVPPIVQAGLVLPEGGQHTWMPPRSTQVRPSAQSLL